MVKSYFCHDRKSAFRAAGSKVQTSYFLTGSEIIMTGIEEVKEIPTAALGKLDDVTIRNHVYLAVATQLQRSCSSAIILRCDLTMNCYEVQSFRTRAVSMQFFKYLDDTYLIVPNWGASISNCGKHPEIYKFDETTNKFSFQRNLTADAKVIDPRSAVYQENVLDTLLSFTPESLFTTKLFSRSLSLSLAPGEVRTFKLADLVYLIRTSRFSFAEEFLDIFEINTTTLEIIKLQQALGSGVKSIDVVRIGDMILLASVQGRPGGSRYIKIHRFDAKKKRFLHLQHMEIPGNV